MPRIIPPSQAAENNNITSERPITYSDSEKCTFIFFIKGISGFLHFSAVRYLNQIIECFHQSTPLSLISTAPQHINLQSCPNQFDQKAVDVFSLNVCFSPSIRPLKFLAFYPV